MTLKDIKTLKELSDQTGIKQDTLKHRLKLKSYNMIEDEDYKNLGHRQATILSPSGISKLLK